MEGLSKKEKHLKIITLLDLTTLEGTDNEAKIKSLCEKAISIGASTNCFPAAVCVYPIFVKQAKELLANKNIKIASVAGAFPAGQSPLNLRVEEVKYAVSQGADEIDMVISRGRFLEGDFEYVSNEIAEIKKACGNAHLKVILETGELQTRENIEKASEIAIQSGADFIKTSTGKSQPAATLEAAEVMLNCIKKEYEKTGKMIGFKPAGGISTVDVAEKYFDLVMEILGEKWLNNNLFRFGASRLADNLLENIK